MPSNFVIGIGGTGARCVESLLHLGAGGLGPHNLWVGFIDQDADNGNLTDASNVLQRLGRLRSRLMVDANNTLGEDRPGLLHTELWAGDGLVSARAGDDAFRWRPTPNGDDTFEREFEYDTASDESKALMDALVHRGPDDLPREKSEQRMPLASGFHGRPGLGAAILLRRANSLDDPFWAHLRNALKPAAANANDEPARILIVGSVFGGTGAGGIPTIARFLREMADDRANNWNLRIGVVLLGPYFKYTLPADDKALGADPGNFPAKLRDSLSYYAGLLNDQPPCERAYLVGWPHAVDLGGDAATDRRGGPRQTNPAMLPELYAALAAADFFGRSDEAFGNPHARVRSCDIVATGFEGTDITVNPKNGARAKVLTWEDLPPPPGMTHTELRRRLGQFIRFCHVYRWFFHDILRQDDLRLGIAQEHWYRRLLADVMQDRQAAPRQVLEDLGVYCERVLLWWAGIDQIRDSQDLPRWLVDSTVFATKGQGAYAHVVLKHTVEDRESRDAFTHMVRGDEASPLPLGAVFRILTNTRPNRSARGLGRFVRALYDACHV